MGFMPQSKFYSTNEMRSFRDKGYHICSVQEVKSQRLLIDPSIEIKEGFASFS